MATSRGPSGTLAFLRQLCALDHAIETVETHMSWVFLSRARAIKLKKPIRLPFLDFSTVGRRRRSCEQELRLGRRLAPSVYQAVLPIVATPAGLALGDADRPSAGEVVDWVVVMRRLPAERMLPAMLARGAATLDDADVLGDALAAFYRRVPRAAWSPTGYARRLRELLDAVAAELAARGAGVDAAHRGLAASLEHQRLELAGRVVEGRVVDAHGDLRPEHVCLERPPVVIDPLEFDDRLRLLDAASELAFFELECERLGAGWFGARVRARYERVAADPVPPALRASYRGLHALTRALIALRRLDDAPPGDHPRWRARAADYLARVPPVGAGPGPAASAASEPS